MTNSSKRQPFTEAGPEEIASLLAPVSAALAPLGLTLQGQGETPAHGQHSAPQGQDRPAGKADDPFRNLTAGQRAAMRLADGASLRTLTVSLLARLEAHEARLAGQEDD